MKTRTLLLGSALAAAMGVGGCTTENRASIQVQSICMPTDTCKFGDTCDAQFIGYPEIDPSVTGRMWLILQVGNLLPDNSNPDTNKTNTNDAHVDEAYVEYDGVALPPASVGSNYLVPAGGTSVISVAVVPAYLSAQATLAAAAPAYPVFAEMVAHVRLRGYYDDGTRFESGDFPVTIRLSTGSNPAMCPVSLAGVPQICPPDSEGQSPAVCLR